jgi:hypothetical protein
MGNMRNAYKTVVSKPEGKRTLERTGHKWEDNIGIDLREIWWGGVESG